jgi:hypothetical protein
MVWKNANLQAELSGPSIGNARVGRDVCKGELRRGCFLKVLPLHRYNPEPEGRGFARY